MRRHNTTRMLPRQLAVKGMWPAPVYEGHFSDNTVLRMSFWTEARKPYDLARARRLFAPGVPLRICTGHWLPAHLEGKRLVMGYLEHDVPDQPWIRFADPFFTGEAAPVPVRRTPRVTVRQARALIGELLADIETGEVRESLIDRARDLAA